MSRFREAIKSALPPAVREAYAGFRARLGPPPREESALHPYEPRANESEKVRLTLALPSLASERRFGGVATGVQFLLEFGRRMDAELRILLDDFDSRIDRAFVESSRRSAGIEPWALTIEQRSALAQPLEIRRNDVFIAFNWWTALNLRSAQDWQQARYGGERRPLIYLVQEYEPSFYPMSSTHMFARAALEPRNRVWGVFNSSQLHAYFRAQGHQFEREHVFEPRLAPQLKPFARQAAIEKQRRILVYGRPTVARNCFPAIVAGLKDWTRRYPQHLDWDVVSAGVRHPAIAIGGGKTMWSVGKLSLEDYANTLRTTAIGLSLMASPHPSYPPLEMAHFGILTLTNRYFCKDLATTHENIVSLDDIFPSTIGEALAGACRRFEERPNAGWLAKTFIPSFLDFEGDPYPFLDGLAAEVLGIAK